ncbi:SusD/RagB family nutrient-binding outer membrane lipoprotein [Algoriphagus sp. CAU 1675]|uniref:SusD/RagB family nutrient-binding outer membrane lipoprotein n=1 Tax=Algoriphagus sp. CAU 1675 TaxID=3032597 RepID=UPI0023DAFC53|nr:SusD/RagB family nutrient-binding outer membrane lipoprotein [Algoriphagus sp. CAU 1675]MDF2158327.1 SusD/RagB family nutrient-binding outer membrane lipoprotein [Algoriphagus sp. CAU 1675]
MRILNKMTGLMLASLMFATSCSEQDLLDLNINKNAVENIDMQYLFSLGTLRIGGEYENTRANMLYAATMIQHTASTAGYFSGDKYFYSAQYSGAYMETHYTGVVRLFSEVIRKTADDPNEVNVNAAATILRVFDLLRMTDMYGDIPYTQAGYGLEGEENWFPTYEPQKEVYYKMIDDLKAARDKFSPSARALGTQDFIYGGDLDKWKKFANSLLMRMAMRMSNVDPEKAKAVFTEANSSGAFSSNDDIAFIHYAPGPQGVNRNGLNDGYWNTYKYSRDCKISETFMNWMDANDDPRKMIITGGIGNPEDASTWITDPNEQIGMPNGYNSTNIRDVVPAGTLDRFSTVQQNFSMLNIKYLDWEDPYYLISYAEVELMRAEAVLKGWISGSAETHFDNGITAAMNAWSYFDPSFVITGPQIQSYVAARGFGSASNEDKLRLIAEEYWAATFLNDIESWSNWRRTGYPVLTPTQDPNAFEGNFIPRRLRYWESEIGSNPENYQAAVSRMGGDLFATKVWWDGGN